MNFDAFKEEMRLNLSALNLDFSDEKLKKFFDFMNLLIEKNKVMNLTGIIEPKEVVLKHFIDSLTVLKYINENNSVIMCLLRKRCLFFI